MQEILRAMLLGVVQGATEFIPVSSSGHLVIVPWLLGWERDPEIGLFFDTVLHWGTLVAILWVFWRELWGMVVAALTSIRHRSLADPQARVAWYIAIGTIPAAVVGLLFKDTFAALYMNPRTAGLSLIVTAGLLSGSEYLIRNAQQFRTLSQLSLPDPVIIGLAQAAALVPGISRSGSTIAAGLTRRIRRDEAARFSFYLGTPVFLGAGLLELNEVLSHDAIQLTDYLPVLVVGFLASAIVGVFAIRFLLAYLRQHSLNIFAVYCALLGTLVIVLTYLRA